MFVLFSFVLKTSSLLLYSTHIVSNNPTSVKGHLKLLWRDNVMNENAILHVNYKLFIIVPLQIRIFQSFFVWMVSLELSWQKDGHCRIETIIITMATSTLCAIPGIHNCIWAVHTVLLYIQLWSQSKHSKWYQRKKKKKMITRNLHHFHNLTEHFVSASVQPVLWYQHYTCKGWVGMIPWWDIEQVYMLNSW